MVNEVFDYARQGWGWRPKSTWAAEIMAEAFSIVKGKLGDLQVTSASMSDPHIKEIIEHTAEQLNLPPATIASTIDAKIHKVEQVKNYSYILYDTIAKKIVRDAAFDLIEHVAKNPRFSNRRVPFNNDVFDDLLTKIRFEQKGFFPLRRPDRYMPINHLSPILVPGSSNPAHRKYDNIPTACATSTGEFVFNTNFMQNLMDFAVIEGAKGKGRKYQSQGGPIPDAYAFIETLILHELLHYKYGDHEKMLKYPQYSHEVHNWAMDFRINHLLSKAGFPQIPAMLLSDHINLDQQGSYTDMMRVVRAELGKLPKPLQDFVDDVMKTDTHPTTPTGPKPPGPIEVPYKAKLNDVVRLPDGTYGQIRKIDPDGTFDVSPVTKDEATTILKYPKGKSVKEGRVSELVDLFEGKYKSAEVTWMKPYESPSPPPPSPPDSPPPDSPPPEVEIGEDPPSPPPPPSGGSSGEDPSSSPPPSGDSSGDDDSIDDDVRKTLDKSDEWINAPEQGPDGKSGGGDGTKSNRGNGPMKSATNVKDAVDKIKPKMNWRRLIDEMVSSSTLEKDYSYQKPHQKTVSGAPIARQAGGMVVKPSERDIEQDINKICIVIDTSGSMGGVIETVLKECQSLLTSVQGLDANSPIGVVFFADGAKWFSVSLGLDRWREVAGAANLHDAMDERNSNKGWKNMLGYRSSGGTNFSSALAGQLGTLAANGWNIVIFSDAGIITDIPANWKLFKDLRKSYPEHIFFIADTIHTFRNAVKGIGGIIPRNWSCIDQKEGA